MQPSGPTCLNSRIAELLIGMLWALGSSPVDAGGPPDKFTAQWAARILDSLDSHPRLRAGQALQKMASASRLRPRAGVLNPAGPRLVPWTRIARRFAKYPHKSALAEEQRYLESFRRAEIRLPNVEAVYRKLFERWTQWSSLTSGRTEHPEALLRRLWDAGEITGDDYLAKFKDRVDVRMTDIRLSGRVRKAWIEWLSSAAELEPWLRKLAGYRDRPGQN